MNELVVLGKSDLELIKEQATLALRSGLLPKGVDSVEKATIIAMKGRELGMSLMRSLENIYVVNGRSALSAALMMSLIQERCPSAKIKTIKSDDKGCVIEASRQGYEATKIAFEEADAKRANLLGRGPWMAYPSDMYWARCVSRMARRLFSDVLQGAVYTPEELGADIDYSGSPSNAFTSGVGADTDRAKDLNQRMDSIKEASEEVTAPSQEVKKPSPEKKATKKKEAETVEVKEVQKPVEPKPEPEPVKPPPPTRPVEPAQPPLPQEDLFESFDPNSELETDYGDYTIRAGKYTGKKLKDLGQKMVYQMYQQVLKLVASKKKEEIQPATLDFLTNAELYLDDYVPGLE